MSTITPTVVPVQPPDAKIRVVKWANITNADTCAYYELPHFADRSVQISGTFDSATVVFQGSNEGTLISNVTNPVTLTDPQGNAISKTSLAIEQIEEVTRFFRPSASGGGGSQSLTVTMLLKGLV